MLNKKLELYKVLGMPKIWTRDVQLLMIETKDQSLLCGQLMAVNKADTSEGNKLLNVLVGS